MLAGAGEAAAHRLQNRQDRVDDGLQRGFAAMLRLDREAAANPFVNGHGSQQRDPAHRAQDPRHRPPVARALGVAAGPL